MLIHIVAGLKCEMARAARGDQGLLPVVRLALRTMGAARCVPPPLRRARSRARGTRRGSPCRSSRMWRASVLYGSSGAALAMWDRRLGVMTCLRAALQHCQNLKCRQTFTRTRNQASQGNVHTSAEPSDPLLR